MRLKFFVSSSFLLLSACRSVPRPSLSAESLDPWIEKQNRISWTNLQKNISPAEPKAAGQGVPLKGIVVAGLSRKDPDYYFHWVRDSANVMRTLVEQSDADPQLLKAQIRDFLQLSAHLQKVASPYGMGEPRYTVTGQADTLPWSRPQYDGPALRALAVMQFLDWLEKHPDKELHTLALQVLRTDLDYIESIWQARGFDMWEEYKADNYNTRLTQLVALERGAHWFPSSRYLQSAAQLEKLLNDHWDPARGFLRSQLAIEATDGYTTKKTDLDSAVIVTVMDVDRRFVSHSVLDERVQATVQVLEDLFRQTYPINQRSDLGVASGRYQGDSYFGGNPWYLITAYYAQFYFRLAKRLRQGAAFTVSKINLKFAQSLLGAKVQIGLVLQPGEAQHQELVQQLLRRGEDVLQRIRFHTPADGIFYEQFDKVTGRPVSSKGLGWAYSTFLAATRERAQALSARPQVSEK
jgi:glucoamylase